MLNDGGPKSWSNGLSPNQAALKTALGHAHSAISRGNGLAAREALLALFGTDERSLLGHDPFEVVQLFPEASRVIFGRALAPLARYIQNGGDHYGALKLHWLAHLLAPGDFEVIRSLEAVAKEASFARYGEQHAMDQRRAVSAGIDLCTQAMQRFLVHGLGIVSSGAALPAQPGENDAISAALGDFSTLFFPAEVTTFGSDAWDAALWTFENLGRALFKRGTNRLDGDQKDPILGATFLARALACAQYATFLLTNEVELERLKPVLTDGKYGEALLEADVKTPRRLARSLALMSEILERQGQLPHALVALRLGRAAQEVLNKLPPEQQPAGLAEQMAAFTQRLTDFERRHPRASGEAARLFTLQLKDVQPDLFIEKAPPESAAPTWEIASDVAEALALNDWQFLREFIRPRIQKTIAEVPSAEAEKVLKQAKIKFSIKPVLELYALDAKIVVECRGDCLSLLRSALLEKAPDRPNSDVELVDTIVASRLIQLLVGLSPQSSEVLALQERGRALLSTAEERAQKMGIKQLRTALIRACDAIEKKVLDLAKH